MPLATFLLLQYDSSLDFLALIISTFSKKSIGSVAAEISLPLPRGKGPWESRFFQPLFRRASRIWNLPQAIRIPKLDFSIKWIFLKNLPIVLHKGA
jgi:hypothetical protein